MITMAREAGPVTIPWHLGTGRRKGRENMRKYSLFGVGESRPELKLIYKVEPTSQS